MQSRFDFVYEGHFTDEAPWDIPRRFKAEGYSIHLIYFGLAGVKLSELRVAARVKKGGHYVDPATVAANFYGNLEKLNQHYALFDTLQVVDTSEVAHQLLAVFWSGFWKAAARFRSCRYGSGIIWEILHGTLNILDNLFGFEGGSMNADESRARFVRKEDAAAETRRRREIVTVYQ